MRRIIVSTKEESIAIQEEMFRRGIFWRGEDKEGFKEVALKYYISAIEKEMVILTEPPSFPCVISVAGFLKDPAYIINS